VINVKLTEDEARKLIEMTKRSLITELNFLTCGKKKEFDVIGDICSKQLVNHAIFR